MIDAGCATALVVVTMFAMVLPATSRPADGPKPSPPAGFVAHVSTELVLADAVVTDKNGRYVTDLQAGDFEISDLHRDGRPAPPEPGHGAGHLHARGRTQGRAPKGRWTA